MPSQMPLHRSAAAKLFGGYCGYRWAVETNLNQRWCFFRHYDCPSFAEFCRRITPWTNKECNQTGRQRLCLRYAQPIGLAKENLDEQPEFWDAFRAGANEGFAAVRQY